MKTGLMFAALLVLSIWAEQTSARDAVVFEGAVHAQSVYDQTRRCKRGFEYDTRTKKCVRKPRGSFSGG